LYFAVANARRTNTNALVRALDYGVNTLQVQIPAALRNIMRMANFITELWPAATDITYF